jgi:hypothetical protein
MVVIGSCNIIIASYKNSFQYLQSKMVRNDFVHFRSKSSQLRTDSVLVGNGEHCIVAVRLGLCVFLKAIFQLVEFITRRDKL